MKRKTLEDVARASNSDLRVRIRYPRLPYYFFDAADDLENLARTLDDMRNEQEYIKHERDEWWSLDDTNLEEIAVILRTLARSEKAREILFSSGKKSEGRPRKHTDRDYLLVLEWCLRRRLSGLEGGAHDFESADEHETLTNWSKWNLSEAMLKKARRKYRSACEAQIDSHLAEKTVDGFEPRDVLGALFEAVMRSRVRRM